jgi:hypothetical protein
MKPTVSTGLPPVGPSERRLLLACARLELGPKQRATIEALLREPLDWEALVLYARLHSIAPLLHLHVKQLDDSNLVPAGARGALLAAAQRAAYQNRVFVHENATLGVAFRECGVSAIVPKGVSTVELVYGRLDVRPLIDLLFLVPAHQLRTAGEVALANGYSERPLRPLHALYDWETPQRWYLKDDSLRFPLVLKGELIGWPRRHRLTSERLRPDARPATLGGHELLVLAPVDLVLYLALQADSNGFFNRAALRNAHPVDLMFAEWANNRVIRFTDIHEVIRHHRSELDWDRLVSRARECRIADSVHASLALASGALETPVPAAALDSLSGSEPPRLRRALLASVAPPRPPRRPSWPLLPLSPRHRLDLLRIIALLEVAFPGLGDLRAEHGRCSPPKLVGLFLGQAASTLVRSGRAYLAARSRATRPAPAAPATTLRTPGL